jgi:hypothetical protein
MCWENDTKRIENANSQTVQTGLLQIFFKHDDSRGGAAGRDSGIVKIRNTGGGGVVPLSIALVYLK